MGDDGGNDDGGNDDSGNDDGGNDDDGNNVNTEYITSDGYTCYEFNADTADTFNQAHLEKHNEYRANHGVNDLVFDAELTRQAYDYACKMASVHQKMQHSTNEERSNPV